jgi:hypothetical protein
MEIKNTNQEVNEDVMKELGNIKWSQDPKAKQENKKEEKKATNKKEEKAKNKKEDKNTEHAVTSEKSKRNILKFGNKEWAAAIPEEERLNEKTIICFKPGERDKLGHFKEYGKKEGIIWFWPYKKDSFEDMSREWAVQLAECEIVEKDGVMLNPERYSKDEKGYHVIKSKVEFETAEVNEISEENKEIENNEINEEKLEENKEIEENKEVSGENIMPMAE